MYCGLHGYYGEEIQVIVKCTECQHEAQTIKNDMECGWCLAPMKAIGDCWMSVSDGSLSTDERITYDPLRVR